MLILILMVSISGQSARGASQTAAAWAGTWTYDFCHEDRKDDHDEDLFCRKGIDECEEERKKDEKEKEALCPKGRVRCDEELLEDEDDEQAMFCREGFDRIRIKTDAAGRYDIIKCPADPWGERQIRLEDSGRRLEFHTRDGMSVRLRMGKDGAHFRGLFRTSDGHSGRIWGRRVTSCR